MKFTVTLISIIEIHLHLRTTKKEFTYNFIPCKTDVTVNLIPKFSAKTREGVIVYFQNE